MWTTNLYLQFARAIHVLVVFRSFRFRYSVLVFAFVRTSDMKHMIIIKQVSPETHKPYTYACNAWCGYYVPHILGTHMICVRTVPLIHCRVWCIEFKWFQSWRMCVCVHVKFGACVCLGLWLAPSLRINAVLLVDIKISYRRFSINHIGMLCVCVRESRAGHNVCALTKFIY